RPSYAGPASRPPRVDGLSWKGTPSGQGRDRVDGLGRRILVAAFDGWNDAGEAASAALAVLKAEGEYEPVFSVDPELYFDYQYTRPQVSIDAEGRRTLSWPETTILRPSRTTRAPQVWLLTGVEPARAWQAY